MTIDRGFVPVKLYLDSVNESILRLHLFNTECDNKIDKLHDTTQQNVEAEFVFLKEQLTQCKQALSVSVSGEDCQLICTLLAIYTDEDILTSGLYPRRIFWPKLQTTFVGSKVGGIVFYDFLDEVLSSSLFNNMVYVVFEYLLTEGYKGKHVNDLSKIQRYREILGGYIEKNLIADL